MCVCWRKEGRVRQQTYVATPEQQPLVSVAHSDTYGLMWPPAVWRGWLAHLPSCPAKLHAGHDTPAWQYASARPWQLAYGNLLPPVERESQGGQWGQLESYTERNKYMLENGIQSVAKKKGQNICFMAVIGKNIFGRRSVHRAFRLGWVKIIFLKTIFRSIHN